MTNNSNASFNKFAVMQNTALISEDAHCEYYCIDSPNPAGFWFVINKVVNTGQRQIVADAIAIKLLELSVVLDEIYMDDSRIVVSINVCTHIALDVVMNGVRAKIAQVLLA